MNTKYYAVFKLTFDSIETTLKRKKFDLVFNILTGFSDGAWRTCSPKELSSKEEAQRICSRERDYNKDVRSLDRCAYSKYKDSFFVHEVNRKNVYVPSVSEIKEVLKEIEDLRIKGLSKERVENFDKKYSQMTPKEIRDSIINA